MKNDLVRIESLTHTVRLTRAVFKVIMNIDTKETTFWPAKTWYDNTTCTFHPIVVVYIYVSRSSDVFVDVYFFFVFSGL